MNSFYLKSTLALQCETFHEFKFNQTLIKISNTNKRLKNEVIKSNNLDDCIIRNSPLISFAKLTIKR